MRGLLLSRCLAVDPESKSKDDFCIKEKKCDET